MAARPILSEKEKAAREQARDAVFNAAPERFKLLFHVVPSPFDVLSSSSLSAMFASSNTLDVPTQPMPATVKQQLRDYSAALFDAESKYYGERTTDAEELRPWLEELAREIAAQVRPIAVKNQLDEHCPASERLAAVSESLAKRVEEMVEHKTRQGLRLTPDTLIGPHRSGWKVSDVEALIEQTANVLGGKRQLLVAAPKASPAIPAIANPWPSPDTSDKGGSPSENSRKRVRQYREPKPELLRNLETVNKAQAAAALGVSPRQVDRYVRDKALNPVGGFGRRRFKTKDLLSFITKKDRDK